VQASIGRPVVNLYALCVQESSLYLVEVEGRDQDRYVFPGHNPGCAHFTHTHGLKLLQVEKRVFSTFRVNVP
jgi:hypothetical protein